MEWTEDNLVLIERLGAALTPMRDVANIFDKDYSDFCEEVSQEALARYERGRLMTTVEVNEAIIRQAKNGSSPAQTLAHGLIQKTTRNELD